MRIDTVPSFVYGLNPFAYFERGVGRDVLAGGQFSLLAESREDRRPNPQRRNILNHTCPPDDAPKFPSSLLVLPVELLRTRWAEAADIVGGAEAADIVGGAEAVDSLSLDPFLSQKSQEHARRTPEDVASI